MIGSIGVVAGAVALAAAGTWLSLDRHCREPSPVALEAPHATDALTGIWWRYEQGTTGDPVRFYYFHGDGTGLYRYGRVGATYTHSLDYELDGDTLRVRFRKTGATHVLRYTVRPGTAGGRDWLTLHGDPREPETTQYYRLAQPRGPRAWDVHDPGELGPPPAGHMWIDLQPFATGGQAFYFYQLRPAGIDGRGVGWFHRGDFDDWSTESLTYRIIEDPPRLALTFDLAGTTETTAFVVQGEGRDRTLRLESDPRDFWHGHVYRDAGKSFGAHSTLQDPRLSAVVLVP